MTDYKLVPIDPTPEMVEAAADAYMPFGDMELAIRMAMLAAPAVQGEPVATLIVDEDATSANYRVTGFRVDALSCVPLGEHDLFLAPPVVKDSLTAHLVAQATPRPADLPPFATKIIEKLQRFNEWANGQGPDIESHWFDILSRLGLLNRGQGSVAWWELSQPGEDVLESFPQPAAQQPAPDSIREGAPYDDPAFESLCREYEIWGTAAAAQCAVFWEAGKRAAAAQTAEQRCEYCVGTGDVHSIDGEWRGTCSCPAGRQPVSSLDDCDLECGAYGSYCKCRAEASAEQQAAADVAELVEALEQFFEGSGIHPGADIERLMMDVSAAHHKQGGKA